MSLRPQKASNPHDCVLDLPNSVTKCAQRYSELRTTNSRLRGDLRDYKGLKGMGLSSRYRLFFRAFQEGKRKEIVILWLGYPRKEGDKKDCYAVFHKMVINEVFPESMEDLIAECEI